MKTILDTMKDAELFICCPACGAETIVTKKKDWRGFYKRYRRCKDDKFHPIFVTVEVPMEIYKQHIERTNND